VRAQQGEISHIGLPRDVKDISGNGNHANHSLKGNITRHAQQNPLGRSQAGGLEDDVGGERGAHSISYPRNGSQDTVQTDAKRRTRDRKRAIEHLTQPLQLMHLRSAWRRRLFFKRLCHGI
jgi:hypothetical protein